MYLSVLLLLACLGQTGSTIAEKNFGTGASQRFLYMNYDGVESMLTAHIVLFNMVEFNSQAELVYAILGEQEDGCQYHQTNRHSSTNPKILLTHPYNFKNCSLVTKAFNAQRAGYKALIIYDMEELTESDVLELLSTRMMSAIHIDVYLVELFESSTALFENADHTHTAQIFPDKTQFDEFMEDKAYKENIQLSATEYSWIWTYHCNGVPDYLIYDEDGERMVTYPYLVRALRKEEKSPSSTTWNALWWSMAYLFLAFLIFVIVDKLS